MNFHIKKWFGFSCSIFPDHIHCLKFYHFEFKRFFFSNILQFLRHNTWANKIHSIRYKIKTKSQQLNFIRVTEKSNISEVYRSYKSFYLLSYQCNLQNSETFSIYWNIEKYLRSHFDSAPCSNTNMGLNSQLFYTFTGLLQTYEFHFQCC